jgi:hypothetical protein
VTTTAAPPPSFFLHPIGHMRAKMPPPIIMANGHPAKARLMQTIFWASIVAACAGALVAGAYFNVLEVNWHIFYLKPAWDGLFHYASWPFYRHGYRDQGEPEVGFLIVGTLIANRKTWKRHAPIWYMFLAPILVVVVSAAGITGVIWLLDFGIPHWLHESQLNHWYLLVGTLIGGVLLGRIVKPIWIPVGATLNGWFTNWSVDRYLVRRAKVRRTTGHVLKAPLWVRHWFLAPLPLRERWMSQLHKGMNEPLSRVPVPKWAAWTMGIVGGLIMLLVLYLTVTGFIAHFWIGGGHNFPFLAPAGS